MTVEIPADLAPFVQRLIAERRFLTEVDVLAEGLRLLRTRCACARFASSAELARAIERGDPGWLETGFPRRCAVWARRALRLPGFARAARATGLAWPLRALGAIA